MRCSFLPHATWKSRELTSGSCNTHARMARTRQADTNPEGAPCALLKREADTSTSPVPRPSAARKYTPFRPVFGSGGAYTPCGCFVLKTLAAYPRFWECCECGCLGLKGATVHALVWDCWIRQSRCFCPPFRMPALGSCGRRN